MNCRFDDLWASAADDGASALVGIYSSRSERDEEIEQLMKAWLRERSVRIESSLVLDQAFRLLVDLLDEGEISPRRRKQARVLIRSIRELRKGEHDDF
jgi:threonine dehydrogenase-like Zn-dependent dehydrogenase